MFRISLSVIKPKSLQIFGLRTVTTTTTTQTLREFLEEHHMKTNVLEEQPLETLIANIGDNLRLDPEFTIDGEPMADDKSIKQLVSELDSFKYGKSEITTNEEHSEFASRCVRHISQGKIDWSFMFNLDGSLCASPVFRKLFWEKLNHHELNVNQILSRQMSREEIALHTRTTASFYTNTLKIFIPVAINTSMIALVRDQLAHRRFQQRCDPIPEPSTSINTIRSMFAYHGFDQRFARSRTDWSERGGVSSTQIAKSRTDSSEICRRSSPFKITDRTMIYDLLQVFLENLHGYMNAHMNAHKNIEKNVLTSLFNSYELSERGKGYITPEWIYDLITGETVFKDSLFESGNPTIDLFYRDLIIKLGVDYRRLLDSQVDNKLVQYVQQNSSKTSFELDMVFTRVYCSLLRINILFSLRDHCDAKMRWHPEMPSGDGIHK